MPAQTEAEQLTCGVCGAPVTATMSASCNWCDIRYHLNPRNDIDAKDCGQVWIDDQYMALQFACNNCLVQQADAGAATSVAASGQDGGRSKRRPDPAPARRYRRRQ